MHDLFDVLYTSAIYAYLNSFYSESIMSFTASLERAYEIYVKLFLHKKGVELALLDEYWKELTKQSERQYGAFCSAYVVTEGTAWHSDTNRTGFRNNVIHKGYIATQHEAKDYAKYVTSRLNLIIKSIKKHFAEQQSSLYFHTKQATEKSVNKIMEENNGAMLVQAGQASLLKWDYADYQETTLEYAIKSADKRLQETRRMREKFEQA